MSVVCEVVGDDFVIALWFTCCDVEDAGEDACFVEDVVGEPENLGDPVVFEDSFYEGGRTGF